MAQQEHGELKLCFSVHSFYAAVNLGCIYIYISASSKMDSAPEGSGRGQGTFVSIVSIVCPSDFSRVAYHQFLTALIVQADFQITTFQLVPPPQPIDVQ